VIRRVPAPVDVQHCPYDVGGVYQRKLPGLTGRPSFRVTLPPIRQRLGDVTQRQVIAEGRMDGRRALERWRIEWVKQHDGWAKRPPHRTASDAEILTRWRTTHADRYCWVLTIALQDPVRLLPQQGHVLREVARRGTVANARHVSPDMLPDGNEYTTAKGATIDRECEAVDAASLVRLAAGRLTRMEKRLERGRRLFGSEA
jgi:hypothetical protein